MQVINVQRKLTVSMTGTSTKPQEQKDHGKGNCVCVQRAEVLKRGAAGTPAGRLPVCLRDVSGHVHPTHTQYIS